MEAKKLALLCRELAENRKAENVVVLDVSKVSSITDYFVIASGTSEPHLRAILNELEDRLHTEHGIKPISSEGVGSRSNWVVLDFFDVIVHLMRPDVRDQFNLEALWSDAPRVKAKAVAKPRTRKPAAELAS